MITYYQTSAIVEVTVHLNGADPVTPWYSSRTIRPTALHIRYRSTSASTWEASVEASGPPVRKDGSDGAGIVRKLMGWAPDEFGPTTPADGVRPSWVEPIVDRYRPGDLATDTHALEG